MSKIPVLNSQGEKLGEHTLADALLETKKGAQAVHDAVEAHQAKIRAGSASTKKRGEVSGGGIKPYKQKGTGRARAGSIRSPIWRGGGIVFGPHPRDYEKKLNKKTSRLAFRRAFTEKVGAGEVVVLDALALPDAKTKNVASVLKKLKVEAGLIVVDRVEPNLALAARNLADVEVVAAKDVHVMQILRTGTLVVTKAGMAQIEERLKKYAGRAE